MSKPRRWMFFHPNDGTRPYSNNDDDNNQLLWERIQELENTVERRNNSITELSTQLQQYQGRVMVGNYITLQDEQRIDRTMAIQFTDRDDFIMHLRRQQATRLAEKLLEENLIEHTFRPDEPNGDYFSRMRLWVKNILE